MRRNIDLSIFDRYKFTKSEVNEISNNIESGKCLMLALSGKLASGKDSLAPSAMLKLGYKNPVHVYFGDNIKNEISQIITYIPKFKSITPEQLTELIIENQGVNSLHILDIATMLLEDYNLNDNLTSRDRTPNMRRVLQLWGTEVRRCQDPLYWVNKTLKKSLSHVLAGDSVYLTDARFPNEVSPAQAVGFIVGRINITPETQKLRLAERDNLGIDELAINHASEISLDDFSNFDFVINNNNTFEEALNLLVVEIKRLLNE